MGLIVEKRVYETIAAASAKDRAHLMELFGVVQDEESITFLMPLMDCDLIVMLNAMSEEHEEVVRTFARRWVAQLALGIDALHWMGIIHRDLKPENILVSASKLAVRIADFNTAYMDHAPLEDDVVYSCDKLGSEPYMAWEVDEGRHYGKMVDWWALGCIMFDMLTNSVLFEGHDARREYARWDDKWEGTSYVASAGKDKLSGAEVDLIYGLVDLDPLKRFQLRNLRYHNFFLNEKKCVNVFDVLLREPAADSDLLTYTSASEPLEVDGSLKDEPLLQAACPGERRSVQAQAQAHVPAQRAHRHPDSDAFEHGYRVPAESGDLFAELDWIHPRGLW
ncbi:kinase-like protein [Dichomitus squalens]|uniref:non-specific serine/threonine protein kinase n=1 Tax=Dichomitus squalens TaxID=114155 RepID=A0A4Q9QA94_9APHY|nr:kinase-like protein [Dichomitus squalens]